MNRGNIITLPDTRLREKSIRIADVDNEVQQLVDDMIAASLDWEESRDHELCAGLAAVQVGVLKRVVVLRVDQDSKNNTEFAPIINPKIIRTEGTPEVDFEGCLSVKDMYGKVPRYPKVKIKALNIDGHEIRITAEGHLARLIQHEIDHTNGILYVDHIKDSDSFYAMNPATGKIEKLDYDDHIKNSKKLWS